MSFAITMVLQCLVLLGDNMAMAADYFPLLRGISWEYSHSDGSLGR